MSGLNQQFTKLPILRKRKYLDFINNAKKNGTPSTGSIEKVKTVPALLSEEERKTLLHAVKPYFLKESIVSVTSFSENASRSRLCTIYHFDNLDKNNQLCDSDIFQQFFKKMHMYAKSYITQNMDHHCVNAFNKLYPNFMPRYCFANLYSKNTKDGISTHRDQTSFLSIVVALQGDDKEPVENCLKISRFLNHDEHNSKSFKLKNGDAVIFERLYHSMVPILNRKNNRVSINIFY